MSADISPLGTELLDIQEAITDKATSLSEAGPDDLVLAQQFISEQMNSATVITSGVEKVLEVATGAARTAARG